MQVQQHVEQTIFHFLNFEESRFRPKRFSITSITGSVTRKNRQMAIKVAQNDFTRKMIDFDNF